MKVIKGLLIVIGIVFVALVLILGRYGLFARVTVTEKPLDSFWIVGKTHIGEYKNVGPLMDSIYYDLLNNYSIKTTRGVGLYYDNPQTVPAEKLRSLVGSILETSDMARIDELKQHYTVRQYPSSQAVIAEFPMKGKLSIFVGIFKVYPKMMKYISEKKYTPCPMLEIYDTPAKKTIYAMSTDVVMSVFDAFLLPEPVAEEVPDSTGNNE